MHMPTPNKGERRVLLGMVILFLAGFFAAKSPLHLLAELRISLFGEETPARVVKVQTEERSDGNRSWDVDLINYTFRIPEGFTFAGVNEANVSETERLIGRPDAKGEYHQAIVRYLPRNPQVHRLKGWGYDGYGPPGGPVSFAVRGLIHLCIVGFACAYAYVLFKKSGDTIKNGTNLRYNPFIFHCLLSSGRGLLLPGEHGIPRESARAALR